uniref:Costars domain-containing protein n=1 Tax=Panagrolaimus sp. ES5 TaxID=591445 RepID=A0AC34F705_9BILA
MSIKPINVTVSDANSVFSKFRQMETSEIEQKKDDVYDKGYVPKKFTKNSAEYGTPKPGTLTEMRAKKASKHIAREMAQLCEIIHQYGKKDALLNKTTITFKELFNVYTYISDKVVGILLRARKHNMVAFEGEMLFQKRDDAVIITVLLTPGEIKAAYANIET